MKSVKQSLGLIIALSLALQSPLAAMDYARRGLDSVKKAVVSNRLITVYQSAKQIKESTGKLSMLIGCLNKGNCSPAESQTINSSMTQLNRSFDAISSALGIGYAADKAAQLSGQFGSFLGAAQGKMMKAFATAREKFDGIRAFGNRLATGTLSATEKAQFTSALKIIGAVIVVVITVVGTVLLAKGLMDKKGQVAPVSIPVSSVIDDSEKIIPVLPFREPLPSEPGYDEWIKIRALPAIPTSESTTALTGQTAPWVEVPDRSGLLGQIQGGVTLKKATPVAKEETINDTLRNQLFKRRQAIEEDEDNSNLPDENQLVRDRLEELKKSNYNMQISINTGCERTDKKQQCKNLHEKYTKDIKNNNEEIKMLEKKLAAGAA